MGQNQQCQTKATSSKTIRNKLRMAISQHITVPKFCKDTSGVYNNWNKHSCCQTGSRKYIHCTFPVKVYPSHCTLPESIGRGGRVKNLTETRSEAQAVLGPAAIHISAVNMSCSYTFSWSINIAKSSQDKVTCMYFHVYQFYPQERINQQAALPLYLPCIPWEILLCQKSSVQTEIV